MIEMNSAYFNNNQVTFKEIELEFDENDDILKNVKIAMKENEISKAEIIEFKGFVKDTTINYVQGGTLKSTQHEGEREVLKGTGEFKLDYKDNSMFGRIRMQYIENGKHFDGILAKGVAGKELKLKMRFAIYN